MKQALKKLVRKAGLERRHVEAARMYGERQALALAPRRRPRERGRILCFHSVGQPAFGGLNDVPPDRFRAHIELALQLGYRFVPPAELARSGGAPNELAVTFDDAPRSVLTEADPILREYNIPYTVFAVSSWGDHLQDWHKQNVLGWDELGVLMERGVEIGGHSATHCNFGVVDEARAREELETSRATIKARLGFAPDVMAIPFGQSGDWTPTADRIAREVGFTTIYAQAEETRPPNTIPRTFVTAFDDDRIFKALLRGAYDRWEEWLWAY